MAKQKINGDQLGTTGGVWSTWTPTITANTNSFTATTSSGRWTRIGNTILLNGAITLTTVGTGQGVQFSLPVTAQAGGPIVGGWREVATAGMTGQVSLTTATTGLLHEYDNSQAFANGNSFRFYAMYEAA